MHFPALSYVHEHAIDSFIKLNFLIEGLESLNDQVVCK